MAVQRRTRPIAVEVDRQDSNFRRRERGHILLGKESAKMAGGVSEHH